MLDIKLIVTDLDNTLLRRDKSISNYTADVFTRIRERGILIAFATTRSETASAKFVKSIAPDIFISNGGSLVRHGEKVLFSSPIETSIALDIISKCVGNSGIRQITVESAFGYYNTKPIDNELLGWIDFSRLRVTDFKTPIEFGDIYKIVVLSEDIRFVQEIIKANKNLTVVSFTDEDWHQIHAVGINKASAVKSLNFDSGEIIAFGDDYNDVELLRYSGTGVAMSNAIDECKNAADFICGDCDDDGVARWLAANILKV